MSNASSPKKHSPIQQCSKEDGSKPTEKELHELSKDVVSEWKSLGRELGVENKILMKIHKDNINYDDIDDKAFTMLMKWKEKMGDSATFGSLREALVNIGLVSTSQKHC